MKECFLSEINVPIGGFWLIVVIHKLGKLDSYMKGMMIIYL
jgi:hypothetical protein